MCYVTSVNTIYSFSYVKQQLSIYLFIPSKFEVVRLRVHTLYYSTKTNKTVKAHPGSAPFVWGQFALVVYYDL